MLNNSLNSLFVVPVNSPLTVGQTAATGQIANLQTPANYSRIAQVRTQGGASMQVPGIAQFQGKGAPTVAMNKYNAMLQNSQSQVKLGNRNSAKTAQFGKLNSSLPQKSFDISQVARPKKPTPLPTWKTIQKLVPNFGSSARGKRSGPIVASMATNQLSTSVPKPRSTKIVSQMGYGGYGGYGMDMYRGGGYGGYGIDMYRGGGYGRYGGYSSNYNRGRMSNMYGGYRSRYGGSYGPMRDGYGYGGGYGGGYNSRYGDLYDDDMYYGGGMYRNSMYGNSMYGSRYGGGYGGMYGGGYGRSMYGNRYGGGYGGGMYGSMYDY